MVRPPAAVALVALREHRGHLEGDRDERRRPVPQRRATPFDLIAIENGGLLSIDNNPLIQVQDVLMAAGGVVLANGSLTIARDLNVTPVATTPATIEGSGNVTFTRRRQHDHHAQRPGGCRSQYLQHGLREVRRPYQARSGRCLHQRDGRCEAREDADRPRPDTADHAGTSDRGAAADRAGAADRADPPNPTRVFEGTLYLSGKHDGEATLPAAAGAGARLGGNGTLGALGADGGISGRRASAQAS